MQRGTGRLLAAIGVMVVLAGLYGLSLEFFPQSYIIGFIRAVIVAVCIWALALWIRPGRKR